MSQPRCFKCFYFQQAKDMVMDLIRDQGFREQRSEYGSRMGGGEGLDVSVGEAIFLFLQLQNCMPFAVLTLVWCLF